LGSASVPTGEAFIDTFRLVVAQLLVGAVAFTRFVPLFSRGGRAAFGLGKVLSARALCDAFLVGSSTD